MDIANRADPDYVYADKGGCWICHRNTGQMVFDTEWDTLVHLDCIREWLKLYPEDPEVSLMKYLLEEPQ